MSNNETKSAHTSLAEYLGQLEEANKLILTPSLLLDLPIGTVFNTEDFIDEPILGYKCQLEGDKKLPEKMSPKRVVTNTLSTISPGQSYTIQYRGHILAVYYLWDGAGVEACVGTTDRTFTVVRRISGNLSAVAFFDPTVNS